MADRGLPIAKLTALTVVVLVLAGKAGVRAVQQPDEIITPAGARVFKTPTNPDEFMRSVDIACVCTVESITPEFRSDGPALVFTKLTLLPVDIIRGDKPEKGVIEMWTLGGSYINTPQGRKLRGVSETVRGIEIGRQYFFAATLERRESSPSMGHYFLNPDVTVELTGSEMRPAPASGKWAEAVVAQGRSLATTGGDKDAFLAALQAGSRTARP